MGEIQEGQETPFKNEDGGQDEDGFLKKVFVYQALAWREHWEMTFHIFASHLIPPPTDDWRDNPLDALARYRELVEQGYPSVRMWVELYSDRENDVLEQEDHLLGYGDWPL
jgi:hypothetical protein